MPAGESLSSKRQRLRDIIAGASLLRERSYRLASGGSSNYFFDMKKTMFDPEGAALIADLVFDAVKDDAVDYVGGLETGAIPLVAALVARSWPEKPIKGFFVRKEEKGHGTDQLVDGLLAPRSRVILFEDVTTTGGSAMKAVAKARQFDCHIVKVLTIVDRLEGAVENFRAAGIPFQALFTRRDFE